MPELRLQLRFWLLGVALAVSYWLVETIADSVFGGEGPVATRLFPADANEVWMRLIIVALILGFTGYISHTLESRARTKQRVQMLQSAVEQTDDAVLITSAELDAPGPEIVYVNEAFCRQSGYAAEELLGQTPRMLQGPDSDPAVLDRLQRCLEREEHFVGGLSNYRKDGSTFRVELRISPVYDRAGNVTHWISVQHDITERERAETALKESEERYRLLVESVEDYAIFMVDPDGRVVSWNEGAERVFGYSEEEIVGEDGFLLFTPEDRRRGAAEEELRQAETDGRAEDERWHVRKDGSTFWGSGFVRPVRDEAGDLRGFSKVVRDITERKRAEKALRENEARKAAIMEAALDCIITMDQAGMITDFNPAAERTFGYRRAEVLGRELAEVIIPRDFRDQHRRGLANYLATGEGRVLNKRIELRGMKADGTEFPVELTIVPIRDGEQPAFTGYLRDITERKRSEEARAQLAAIVESSDDAIISKTLDGIITSWNAGAQKLYGYISEETVGKHLSMLAPPERRDEIAEVLAKIRSGGTIHNRETVRLTKDGRRIDVSLTVSPVKGSEGNIVGASIIARDISERKKAESTLREVREAERRQIAHDLHDDVLQELMDALYSMQVTRMKLRSEEIDIPEIDEQIDDLRKATHSLRDAINNLRRESIQKQPFLHVLRSVVLANRQKAPHIELDLNVDTSFSSESLGSNGIELLRIIQEALVNVRRHSWASHVRVSLREEEDFLTAEVVDDGRGFDPELAWGGVGVSAMQERASKLGSDLEIHSEPGRGTRVAVRVPTALVLAAGAPDNPSEI
jgi:PAS domain S-box-containing protein